MTCRVDDDGLLQTCSVVSEAPMDAGWGKAVLDLAPSFQMAARTGEGEPVRGREVRIPVRFTPTAN